MSPSLPPQSRKAPVFVGFPVRQQVPWPSRGLRPACRGPQQGGGGKYGELPGPAPASLTSQGPRAMQLPESADTSFRPIKAPVPL